MESLNYTHNRGVLEGKSLYVISAPTSFKPCPASNTTVPLVGPLTSLIKESDIKKEARIMMKRVII